MQKAIVAAVTSLVALGSQFGWNPPEVLMAGDWIQAIAMVVAPFLVWAVPNARAE